MPIPILHALISRDGQVLWLSTESTARYAYLRSLAKRHVDVLIRPHREQRTSPQNRYLWGVCYALIAEHCGYEVDELHEALAMKFLRIEDDPLTGSPRRRRTPKTDTAEFAAYVEACRRFAAVELGVVIPDPEQVVVP